MSIYEKLIKAQVELEAPKEKENTFGNYKYRSAEDILEAVKPINEKHGLILTLTDEPLLVGERYYIKASATLTDGEQTITVNGFAREALNRKGQDDSQITGTASSYARKYALNGLYLIDDSKDADTNEFKQEKDNRSKAQQNNQQQQQNNQQQQQNDFGKNKQEVVRRLKAVAEAKKIEFADAKRMVLEKTNKDLERNDKDIVPANISRVFGYVVSIENSMKEGEQNERDDN